MPNDPIIEHTFRNAKRIVLAACLLAIIVYFATGIYSVTPTQTGVIKRFGVIVNDDISPGIHYHWPWPIELVARPNTKEIRSMKLVFDQTTISKEHAGEGALLTGDENLVLLTLLTQYTIDNPRQYLTVFSNPDELLKRLILAACVRYMAGTSVDDILTTGRNNLQRTLKSEIQKSSNRFGLGLRIVSIQVKNIEPPTSVAHAFKDVASAREDMHKMLQNANGEKNRRLPEARADAESLRQQAEAYANETVQKAKGDADRFLSTWKEYRKAKSVTAQRIYFETVESIMTKVKKQIINPRAERRLGQGGMYQ